MVFHELWWEPGVYSRLQRGWPFKIVFVQGTSVLLSSYEGHLTNVFEAWQNNRDASRGEAGDPGSLSSCHRNIGLLSIFKRSQASSAFEAVNSACLSRCQMDVRPPVEMRREPRGFSMVSTGDSDIPSSCEMKDEPAFKPLQGNPAFFQDRASRSPFHLRQQTQGPSHIPITERSLLLRCLWKVGIPLESNPGNQLSSQEDLAYTEVNCCAELGVPLDLGRYFWGISGVA